MEVNMSHDNHCCHNDSHGCCDSHEHHHDHEESHHDHFQLFAKHLLCLADEAWEDVLIEKIKQEILKNSGDHLSELAKLIASANSERWRTKMSAGANCENFMTQLKTMMGKGCCNSK
jgi:ABC-type Zn2+ transport system substrate-binding protein/surface adhesin